MENELEPPSPEQLQQRVKELKNKGLSDNEIYESLQNNGYPYQRISEAIDQSQIKEAVEEPLIEPPPATQEMQQSQFPPQYEAQQFVQQPQRDVEEKIEEVAESIIKEKWDSLMSEFGDLTLWKENLNNELTSIKQEILRMETRLDNLQRVMVGKVGEYDQNIKEVGSEVKALEQVLQRIIKPLTTNVKELTRLTDNLKNKEK